MFPGQPYFFTANVTGFLKKHGLNITNYDANLDVWEYILNPAFLSKIEYKPAVFRKCPSFLAADITAKQFAILKGNVLNIIEKALHILKDKEDFYDIRKLNWAHYAIFKAQQLIYYQYGTFIGFRTVFWPEIGFKVKSLDDIYRYSMDEEHNPFISVFNEVILPKIAGIQPDIIGTEMFFPWEIIQVLTLNLLIKKHFPGIHLNFLGQGFDEINFARIIEKLKVNDKFLFHFDTIFLARSNQEVLKLYALDKITPEGLKNLAGIAYKENDKLIIKGPFDEGDMDFEIYPDYSDLPLERYYTPQRVFIDKISSKCFWNQCTYCSINFYKQRQQIADLDVFINRVQHYIERYNCRHLWLLDEATPPEIIDRFATRLLHEQINLIWSVRTRIDKKLTEPLLQKMHRAGCRELWIGLETVSPKLLKTMHKTDDPDGYPSLASQLMKMCNRIGIGIHFCIFLGFPSEDALDRKLLLAFFRENRKHMNNIPYFATFNEFWLMKDSKIYNDPATYGITKIIEKDDHYNMVDIPYEHERNLAGKKHKSPLPGIHSERTERMSKKLLSFFVRDIPLTLLWFNASDSYQELLLKEKFQGKNPFRKRTKFYELVLLLCVLKWDNSPLLSKLLMRLYRKYSKIHL
jgi:radical SAM superfamily enzyme YgiQ (UPF0313 family)